MALNFPSAPTVGQTYADPESGFSYSWNGVVWLSYTSSNSLQIRTIDDISGLFDDTTTSFVLKQGGNIVAGTRSNQYRITLGGIVQSPEIDYTISGNNIVFSVAPLAGLTFSGVMLGNSIGITEVADGSVTPLKISTGGPYWDTSGNTVIVGVLTANNLKYPVSDGNANDVLVTNGSGVLSFAPPSTLGLLANVVEDTTPQLGGNLDMNNKVINGTGQISITGEISATDFNTTSDINLKENIENIDNPLAKVLSINGVTFNWKSSKEPSAGVIAQEIEKILPQLINETEAGTKSVNYNGLIGLLIEAVKELSDEVKELKGL